MPATPPLQIAIDGPAASGKSTLARHLAEAMNLCYVNTGAMYRALTWAAIQRGIDPHGDHAPIVALLAVVDIGYRPNAHGQLLLTLDGEPVPDSAIRAPAVTAGVSDVSAIPAVRDWMVARQRESATYGDVVMEGRDIGTVVLPDAPFKFFVVATARERARRRLAQAGEVTNGATIESVAAEIRERDRLDSTRAVAPLRPADDAELIDTTAMSIDQVVATIREQVEHALRPQGPAVATCSNRPPC